MDLIRAVLLAVEAEAYPHPDFEKFTNEQVMGHYEMLIEGGFITGSVHRDEHLKPKAVVNPQLTWEGHDFVEAARNDTLWAKAKGQIAEAGGSWTVDILKGLLTRLAAEAVKLGTGMIG